MTFSRYVVLGCLVAGAACKSRGAIDISVEFPASCVAATHVRVYMIRGAVCGDCACGDCLRTCTDENCTVGCDGDYCDIAALDTGLTLRADTPGPYAVVYQLVAIDSTGRAEEVAGACADGVQLDKDGTSSSAVSFVGTCCPFDTDVDAGG